MEHVQIRRTIRSQGTSSLEVAHTEKQTRHLSQANDMTKEQETHGTGVRWC